MRTRNAFTLLLKRFTRANRLRTVHPPTPAYLHTPKRPKFGLALGSSRKRTSRRRLARRDSNPLLALGAKIVVGLAFFLVLSAQAGVREVGSIGLTVGNLDRELFFYTNTLPFELIDISEAQGVDQDRLLGEQAVRLRTAELKLGDEHIRLTEHLSAKGWAIPSDSRSYDHWFQHIAIVVRDMDQAYARLRQRKVKHVSTAPQTLPEWNINAGGIKAFYFCDPEDHVLEIIFFPPGKGDPKWQRQAGDRVFLGIDHTAIVVSDTDKSLAFYRDVLGFRVAGESENYGVEQEHLNQVFGARLHITGLRAEHGPGIEFLEYITPPGGRPLPPDAKANDFVFWNTHLAVDHVTSAAQRARESGAQFVSKHSENARAVIVRDPDGHALELDEATAATASVR